RGLMSRVCRHLLCHVQAQELRRFHLGLCRALPKTSNGPNSSSGEYENSFNSCVGEQTHLEVETETETGRNVTIDGNGNSTIVHRSDPLVLASITDADSGRMIDTVCVSEMEETRIQMSPLNMVGRISLVVRLVINATK